MRRIALSVALMLLILACGDAGQAESDQADAARFCEIQDEMDNLAEQIRTDVQITEAMVQDAIRSFGPLGREAAEVAPADIRPAAELQNAVFDSTLELYEEANWDFTRMDPDALQTLSDATGAAGAEIEEWRREHC